MEASYKIEKLNDDRPLKEKWLTQWGNFPAESLRDPSYSFFILPTVEGMIGYKVELGCAVTFGDPICSKENTPVLAKAFHDYCQSQNLNITYLISSGTFAKWAVNNICNVLIEVGEEITFDPRCDPLEGPRNKLRNKVNHAQHIGLYTQEYVNEDPQLEKEIQAVGDLWLKSRTGPQIYLANVNFFEDRTNKRWFYVKNQEGVLVGVALLTRLEVREGWYLKFLITLPDAPRGTSERLMVDILDTLKNENCRFLTYGLVPGENLGELVGIGSWSSWFVKKAFTFAKKIFKLENRKAYWGQFHPILEPTYVLFEKPKVGLKEIRVVLRSLRVDL